MSISNGGAQYIRLYRDCQEDNLNITDKGRVQKKKKMEISIFGFGPPPPPKDGKVEQKKTSFRVLMAFSPIIGIKDGKSKKKFWTPHPKGNFPFIGGKRPQKIRFP